jgi:hypothetical protein
MTREISQSKTNSFPAFDPEGPGLLAGTAICISTNALTQLICSPDDDGMA